MSGGLCPLLDPEAYLLHPFWGRLDWGVEMYKYKSNFTTLNHEILLRTKTASHGVCFPDHCGTVTQSLLACPAGFMVSQSCSLPASSLVSLGEARRESTASPGLLLTWPSLPKLCALKASVLFVSGSEPCLEPSTHRGKAGHGPWVMLSSFAILYLA